MAKENIISKLKWIGVIAIISSIVSFILIPFLDYFSDKVLKFDFSKLYGNYTGHQCMHQ
jgi:uncharacterized membrane protein